MATKTQIKKVIKHDSLSVKATFPTGDSVKFKINRTGESVEMSGVENTTEARQQIRCLQTICKRLGGELNSERIDRLGAIFAQHESIDSLINTVG